MTCASSALSLIPAATTARLLRRGVMFWLLLRLMLLFITRGKNGMGTPSPGGMIVAAIAAGIIAYSELTFFRERTLAANLGVWHGWYAVLPAAVSFMIDALLWAFVPGLREFTWIELA
ncbi:MAG TPA: hypothetical protein VF035_09985 [Longimicrobiales bacterium]